MLTKVRAEYVELVIKKRCLARLFGGSSYASPRTMGAQFPRGAEMGLLGFLGNNSAPRGAPDPGEVSFDGQLCWLQVCFCERGDWLTESRDITRKSRGRSKKFA